jgi:hypothetical protein
LNQQTRPANVNTAQFLKALTRVKQNNFIDDKLDKTTLDLKSPPIEVPNRKKKNESQ